jgi:phosphoglucosamine mutase
MGKYFGTDGVRGIANSFITPELAFKIGRCLGDAKDGRKKIVIGKDSRISSDMIEAALVAGITSAGSDVLKLGVIPTPAVSYVVKHSDANNGIMITASHNPVSDNGIKIFKEDGFKLLDSEQNVIEEFIDGDDHVQRPTGANIGAVSYDKDGREMYINFLKNLLVKQDDSYRIVIDCAYGATASLIEDVFADANLDVIVEAWDYDGTNINSGVGSTYPEFLQSKVKEHSADFGFSFDGDGDRIICVNANGAILDGDYIMFILARYLRDKDLLKKNTVVSTIMSNFGFNKACKKSELETIPTKVGDRYVLEEMLNNGYNLGGEQSGHIILLDHNSTGDAILTAIMLLNVMSENKEQFDDSIYQLEKYPQLLKNVTVSSKDKVMSHPLIQAEIKRITNILDGDGRVLVRPSGTEPLVRVMVEAKTDALCEKYVDSIIDSIKECGYSK